MPHTQVIGCAVFWRTDRSSLVSWIVFSEVVRLCKETRLVGYFVIPLLITGYFWNPVFTVMPFLKAWLQHFPIFAMKKIPITKNGNFIFCNDNIGGSRQAFIIFSVSESFLSPCFTQYDFDFRIIRLNMLHIFPALLFGKPVHCGVSLFGCPGSCQHPSVGNKFLQLCRLPYSVWYMEIVKAKPEWFPAKDEIPNMIR